MRIWEMAAREDFRDVFKKTMERDWTRRLGAPVELSFDSVNGDSAQIWRLHPGVDCFTVMGVDAQARGFIRDSFRHSPVPHRRALQWLIGTGLGTSMGLRLWAKQGFSLTPEIAGAEHLVILPCNQRIRVFDFEKGVTRAILKEGFRCDGMRREIEVRAEGAEGPFPPISAHAEDYSWFEEPIIESLVLSRCPSSVDRSVIMQGVYRKLQQWTLSTRKELARRQWADKVRQEIISDAEALHARYGHDFQELTPWLDRITEAASDDGTIEVSQTHGDLHEGNVLITVPDSEPLIIDWEHSRVRSCHYDSFILGLGSRWGHGFSERLTRFVTHGGMQSPLDDESFADPLLRRREAAIFLMEDLSFYLHESLSGPYRCIPNGLGACLRRLGVEKDVPPPQGFLGEFL